jgi:Xaa-Pro aminopeptidase
MGMRDYTIHREKVKQLEALLGASEIDGLLILSREASDPMLPFLCGEDSVQSCTAFFRKDGKHVIIASKADEKKFLPSGIFSKIRAYTSSMDSLILEELEQLNPARLALNISTEDAIADGLSYGQYLYLEKLIGKEKLGSIEVSGENLVRELCSVKSSSEIGCLSRCIQITNDIYDEVLGQVRCGMSEKEIGDLFVAAMKKREVCNGLGEPYDYPIVCIVRAGLSHRGPGDTKTIPGDIVIMDFSVKSEGFISDIARTAYCLKKGETMPPAEIRHAFDTAYKAISAVIDFIGPGKKGYEVDKAGRDIIEAGGYPTVRHSVGHPIGRKCHDSGTLLGPRREGGSSAVYREIQKNEVYAIEPTIIQDDGLPCMLVEENVVIRKEGAEVLSRRQEALYLIAE